MSGTKINEIPNFVKKLNLVSGKFHTTNCSHDTRNEIKNRSKEPTHLFKVLELLVALEPLLLAHAAVDADGREVLLDEELGQGDAALDRADKDDNLGERKFQRKRSHVKSCCTRSRMNKKENKIFGFQKERVTGSIKFYLAPRFVSSRKFGTTIQPEVTLQQEKKKTN